MVLIRRKQRFVVDAEFQVVGTASMASMASMATRSSQKCTAMVADPSTTQSFHVWQVAASEANETLVDHLAQVLLRRQRQHPNVFAIKVPRFVFSQTYRMLARVRGTCATSAKCETDDLHRCLDFQCIAGRLHSHHLGMLLHNRTLSRLPPL